ncbi:uncharacterized protein LOC110694984 isoform X2 [Chenopodium quinoa]|nr:uncharacterized protein LOC110694984 isoform X2 [Chenopodium quinoa]
MNCRIESFGRICQSFDEQRQRWVREMGFGSLLNLVDVHLPRQLAYWLMTRIDPFGKVLRSPDGRLLKLFTNQVHWVLGIPNGGKEIPTWKNITKEMKEKVQWIQLKYRKSWETRVIKVGRVYTLNGIPVNSTILDRLEGSWQDDDEEEFKTVFLLVVLEMVLCPTHSPRLASDLIPTLSCAMVTMEYDGCELVLVKLLDSVVSFARRFYRKGYAGGCGGCLIFIVILYLDGLRRDPLRRGIFPRVKVWDMKHIWIASKEDRLETGGDFGKLGLLDVAYGEGHPKEA